MFSCNLQSWFVNHFWYVLNLQQIRRFLQPMLFRYQNNKMLYLFLLIQLQQLVVPIFLQGILIVCFFTIFFICHNFTCFRNLQTNNLNFIHYARIFSSINFATNQKQAGSYSSVSCDEAFIEESIFSMIICSSQVKQSYLRERERLHYPSSSSLFYTRTFLIQFFSIGCRKGVKFNGRKIVWIFSSFDRRSCSYWWPGALTRTRKTLMDKLDHFLNFLISGTKLLLNHSLNTPLVTQL